MTAPVFFIVQSDDGLTEGANAYCDLAYFRAYCLSRGKSLVKTAPSTDYSDDEVAVALINGRDYMDNRWTFKGDRMQPDQTTEWPRISAYDNSQIYINGITDVLKQANSAYGYIALTVPGGLNPTPSRDGTGAAVQSKTTQVGPILKSVRYVEGATFSNPTYPDADNILKSRGYTISGSTLIRG